MATPRDQPEPPSRFEYRPPTILHGLDAVDRLGEELERAGLKRVLVVTGRTVGRTDAVMDPVRDALGDRLGGVFADTTPDKRLSTAIDAAAEAEDVDADVIVGLGGGSSLDVATVASVVGQSDRSPESLADTLVETGTLPMPGETIPVVTVPTTLAGAALSGAAGITVGPAGGLVTGTAGGGVSGETLVPLATVYDPRLVATTPVDVLRGSAMNGFDKGLETLYSRFASPVTDGTAMRGVGLFARGVDALATSSPSATALAPVVEGTVLAEFGAYRRETTTLSLIHSFGHALTRTEALQQGVAHAIVAPHALRHLFGRVDGRREVIAAALDTSGSEPAPAVVETVADIVETLGLPRRLRDVEGPDLDAFPDVALDVLSDSMMAATPRNYDPDPSAIEAILEDAW